MTALKVPNTAVVITIIAAITEFLGVILGVSSYNYNKKMTNSKNENVQAFRGK